MVLTTNRYKKMSNTNANTATAMNPPVTKASIARTIFAKTFGTVPRKDIITQFALDQSEGGAGLTPSGAATYYQKFKKLSEATTTIVPGEETTNETADIVDETVDIVDETTDESTSST